MEDVGAALVHDAGAAHGGAGDSRRGRRRQEPPDLRRSPRRRMAPHDVREIGRRAYSRGWSVGRMVEDGVDAVVRETGLLGQRNRGI